MKLERSRISPLLEKAISATFEGMAFLELAPAPSRPPLEQSGPWIWAAVRTAAPFTGKIAFYCPLSAAEEITLSMYGSVEGGDLKQTVKDSVGEVANTLAGRLISDLIPPQAAMTLMIPEVGEGLDGLVDESTYYFVTDELVPIAVVVELA